MYISSLNFTWTWCCSICGKIISQNPQKHAKNKLLYYFRHRNLNLGMTWVLIGITFPSCARSQEDLSWHLCLTCLLLLHAFAEPAVPISALPPKSLDFLFSLLFLLSITLPLLSAAFVSLCPLIYLKARPAGFGCFPPSPKRPVFTPCSSSCPLVSLPAESKGCSGLKGRTPDGHRHVGHALCDGAWLRALWTSHSCQS